MVCFVFIIGEQASIYFEHTRFCTDGSGSLIGTKEKCEEAAGIRGWSDTTARTDPVTGAPNGCWGWNNGGKLRKKKTKTKSTFRFGTKYIKIKNIK
jgi:hypothetical protein